MHEGHRDRVKKRFRQEGLDHFSDIQALELLLFYGIPRVDTNPIAHALLDRFGSLSQVLEASPEELMKVPGVGENAALLLTLIPQMGRFYMVDRSSRVTILQTLEQCADFLVPHFFGRKVETVFILCLDAKCKLLCCKELGEGGPNSTGVSIRKIVETAIGVNAATVVLAHNHPAAWRCHQLRISRPPAALPMLCRQWKSPWRITSLWRMGTMFPLPCPMTVFGTAC